MWCRHDFKFHRDLLNAVALTDVSAVRFPTGARLRATPRAKDHAAHAHVAERHVNARPQIEAFLAMTAPIMGVMVPPP